MTQTDTYLMDFIECDTCRALPGSPPLCRGCLHNREVIGQLKRMTGLVQFPQSLGDDKAPRRKRDWPGIIMFWLIVGGILTCLVVAP